MLYAIVWYVCELHYIRNAIIACNYIIKYIITAVEKIILNPARRPQVNNKIIDIVQRAYVLVAYNIYCTQEC